MDNKLSFQHTIHTALADHPDWLPEALEAVSSGMARALRRADERAAKSDAAFLAALGLAEPKRLHEKTKAALNKVIASAINPEMASKIEERALARAEMEAESA